VGVSAPPHWSIFSCAGIPRGDTAVIRILQIPPDILSLINPDVAVIVMNSVEITQDGQPQRVQLILQEPEHLTLVVKGDGSRFLEYDGDLIIRPIKE
jgi:hypothetical protein